MPWNGLVRRNLQAHLKFLSLLMGQKPDCWRAMDLWVSLRSSFLSIPSLWKLSKPSWISHTPHKQEIIDYFFDIRLCVKYPKTLNFIHKGDKDSSALIPIPIIDVSLLSSEREPQKLRSALTSAGCFQVWIYKTFQKPHLHCYLHVFQRTIT